MEKSAVAKAMSTPEIVISEHIERTSSSSSDSWNSTSSPLPQPSRTEAQPQHGIEFGEFALPSPLPPQPDPDTNSKAQALSTERQLPPPIPSRSMLRTVPYDLPNETECSGALPAPDVIEYAGSSENILRQGNEHGDQDSGRDIRTVNQIRAHLPRSFYAPPPSAREMEMRKVPTSYYAPAASVIRLNEGDRVHDLRSNRGRAVNLGRGVVEDSELVHPARGNEATSQGRPLDTVRGRGDAGDCELVQTQRRRMMTEDCELAGTCHAPKDEEATKKKRGKKCCGCRWTKTRFLVLFRVVNMLFAIILILFNAFDLKGLGLAGMIIARTYLFPFTNCYLPHPGHSQSFCAIPLLLPSSLTHITQASTQLFFNFSILTAQCCLRSFRPSTHRKSKTYTYTLVAVDFLLAIALMVVGMVSLVVGLVAETNDEAWWWWEEWGDSYSYGYESEGRLSKVMGALWLSAGFVEGVCWGLGAFAIWG